VSASEAEGRRFKSGHPDQISFDKLGVLFMSVRNGLSKVDEAAANKLAAYILMPADLLEQAIADVLEMTGETRLSPLHVEAIAERLKVSTTALSMRLGVPT